MGNLQDFLRSSHGSVIYANMAGNSLTLTNRDLLSFAWQVARGMSYLASQKVSSKPRFISNKYSTSARWI